MAKDPIIRKKNIDKGINTLTKQLSKCSIDLFPKEFDEIDESNKLRDEDEILENFTHSAETEYEDAVFFKKISKKFSVFLKENTNIKFTPSQKKKINTLINLLFEKMVIYLNHIQLNPLHTIYSDLDDSLKTNITVIKRIITKVYDYTYEKRTKNTVRKNELIVFLNNCYKLFQTIIDTLEQNPVEPDIESLKI